MFPGLTLGMRQVYSDGIHNKLTGNLQAQASIRFVKSRAKIDSRSMPGMTIGGAGGVHAPVYSGRTRMQDRGEIEEEKHS
jgi:hypothetical protein